MAWPLSSDYSEALQNPRTRFNDAELRQAAVTQLDSGEPVIWSGGFAAVFQVRQPQSDKKWAVKCFTRKIVSQTQRYRIVSDYLQSTKLPFRVAFQYLQDELLVSTSSGAARYPVVKMDWVDGLTLDQFAAEHLDKPNAFAVLAKMWATLAKALRRARVAHADLQHGNVILVQTSATTFDLKLIDYDGMYVPGLEALPSGELGQPNFQHPLRRDVFDLEIDRFSHLVIYTTLRALAFRADNAACSGERLWARHHNQENLLFLEKDFKEPARSELFKQLWQHPDADLRRLAGHLVLAAVGQLDQVPLLDDVQQDAGTVPLNAEQMQQAIALLGTPPAQPVAETVQPWPVAAPWLTPPKAPPAQLQAAPTPVVVGRPAAKVVTGKPRAKVPTAHATSKPPNVVLKALLAGTMCLGLLLCAFCLAGFALLAWEAQTEEDESPTEATHHSAKSDADLKDRIPAKDKDHTRDHVDLFDYKFVQVPKGTFWMSKNFENALVLATIAEDFELSAYTVTQEQWQAAMGHNPSFFVRQGQGQEKVKDMADADLKHFPVENVSWVDVQDFLKKLNEHHKGKGWLYRLPTEAEWEYACRGAGKTWAECAFDFYLDKPTHDLSSTQANFNGNFPAGKAAKGPYLARPTKVGSYAPNQLGLYDMHGNVAQWCEDLWDARGSDRVYRGSSWFNDGRDCRAADRGKDAPTKRLHGLGFRLARVRSGGQVTVKDKTGPLDWKFVQVPQGTFWMGGGSDRAPTKQETIAKAFELAAYTVTQQQWQTVMGNNPSWFARGGGGKDAVKDIADVDLKRFPVENVSWNDVQEFLQQLNEREKGKGWQYRLPSEAEWEFACRGAATTREECSFDFYLDKPTHDLFSTQANFNGSSVVVKGAKGPNLGRTTKVGSYAPNQLGLYDMHGNVAQWCAGFFDSTGTNRVFRGSSWEDYERGCRAANRFGLAPFLPRSDLGFRLVRVAS